MNVPPIENHEAPQHLTTTSRRYKKGRKGLLEYIQSPTRIKPLVGLHEVVEIRFTETGKRLAYCKMCNVRSGVETVMQHLQGLWHITNYANKYFPSLLEHFRNISQQSGKQKRHKHLIQMLTKFAREREDVEGIPNIEVEYVTITDGRKTKESEKCDGDSSTVGLEDQKECERQIALQYSENFKVSSQKEANEVQQLTEHLNNLIKDYKLKSQGLYSFGLHSSNDQSGCSKRMAIEGANEHGVTDKIPAKTGLQGKKVKAEETVEPLVMIPVHPLSSINKTKDQNPTGQKYFSHPVTEPNYNSSSSPSSISGMSNMKQNAEQPSCSSHLFSLNTHVSTPVVPTQERHAVSSITANMNIAPVTEVPITGRVTDTQETSSTINSNKPPLESPSSSNATGKTSNTLTPDILKLLKGKDIDSVITCLKALAPFYPALQDVNIEMFAQVLANVGALE